MAAFASGRAAQVGGALKEVELEAARAGHMASIIATAGSLG
jgi:hypothetical protein